MLSLGTIAYLACLPLGWLSYRNHVRQDEAAAAAAASPAEEMPLLGEAAPADEERPNRLN